MKPGDRVMIYEDPITQERQEGMATLVKRCSDVPAGHTLESWLVRFDDDGDRAPNYGRVIYNPEANRGEETRR